MLPCTNCNVNGEGDRVHQGGSKSVFRGKREIGTINTVYSLLVSGIQFERTALMGANVATEQLVSYFEVMFITKICLH